MTHLTNPRMHPDKHPTMHPLQQKCAQSTAKRHIVGFANGALWDPELGQFVTCSLTHGYLDFFAEIT